MTAVNEQSTAVKEMAANWPIIDALMGGTAAMRRAGRSFLPQWPNEEDASYNQRLATATLFPAFSRTVGVMAGKPFSKQVTLGENTPERIVELCQDIDGEGRSLHVFAADLMQEAVSFGFGGILVDFTRTEGQARTQADEKAMGARPYWVHIKHGQILGWRTGKVAGVTALTQLRLAETAEVDDGEFGTKAVNRVRVLTPGAWELYEETTGGYQRIDGGTTTLQAIPFVPVYGRRVAYMMGKPPLIDLAHLNVKHWQSQSDQDTILHVARVPILATIGADEATITVGASAAVKLPPGAEMMYVEHTGAAIDAGAKSLEALEAQMIQTGAELLVAQPGERSATEAEIDAEANKSELQRIVETFEDSIDQALQFTADWLNLPEGGSVSLFKDFAASSLSEATAALLLQLQQGGVITKRTLIREQQRRGIIAPDVVPEDELEAVKEEGPSLGSIGDD